MGTWLYSKESILKEANLCSSAGVAYFSWNTDFFFCLLQISDHVSAQILSKGYSVVKNTSCKYTYLSNVIEILLILLVLSQIISK